MIALLLFFIFVQEPKMVPCAVTEVVEEGVRSDCHGWQPAKGEKMFMFGDVSKQLKVGDVFYFVWKETRWVAEIRTPQVEAPSPKIVTCTVAKPDQTVNCVQTSSKRRTTGTIFQVSDQDLTEWRLTAPLQEGGVNSDAPLFEVPLTKGQTVKAIIDGNKLIPVASCSVRVWHKLKDYTSSHPGERVPFGLRTEPDDCQPWYGKQD